MKRFVVDTNVLFSFFWKNSWVREIVLDPKIILFSPEKVFEELDKHSEEICCKAKISSEAYGFWRKILSLEIIEVRFEEFKEKLRVAYEIAPDEKDVELFAIALTYDVPIWSNEKRLKKQKVVKVFSNEEIFRLFGFKH